MVNSGKRGRITSIKPTESQLYALEKLKRLDLNLHVTLNAQKRVAKTVFGEHVIYPKDNKYYVAWTVAVPLIDPVEEWHVFLDFRTGNILDILDALLKSNGRGRVFIPNPVVALGDIKLTAESEIPDRAYSTVILKDLDGSGYLRGRYVDTESTPNRAKEQDLIFNYSRPDPRFNEVMAYYHIDEAARYDDAEDADVILHEYCHAVLDEQVPGFGLNWSTCPIAEGFGDFFAACFLLK